MNFVQTIMRKIFLLLPFFLFLSCNNPCKEPDEIPLTRLSQEVEDYGVFQAGTYWVYANDSTFAIDSVAVIATKRDTLSMDKNCEGVYITIGYYEQFDAFLSPNFLGEAYTLESEINCVTLISTLPNQIGIYCSTDTSSLHLLDSLEVAGKIYHDIFIFHNALSSIDNGHDADYYSARNIGIIKKEVFVSADSIESWSLIRSHIIQ